MSPDPNVLPRVRPACADDCRLLFDWANDPAVRAMAFSNAPIPWEDHERWFARRLADERCTILIGADATGAPVGQVRFDATDAGELEADISVDPKRRGQGWGARLISAGVGHLRARGERRPVVALIKRENDASRRAFARAGFRVEADVVMKGFACVRMILENVAAEPE